MTALLQIRAAVSLAGAALLTLPVAELFLGANTLEALCVALAMIAAVLLAAAALAAWVHSRAG